MTKALASPKLTGGGGFSFEDKVAAYFLSFMLTQDPPLDPSLGSIKKIEFQVKPLGWLLDDILLTLESDGRLSRVAISVKSFDPFSASKAPREFVDTAWEQFTETGVSGFDSSTDKLCLATGTLSSTLSSEIQALLESAQKQDPKSFLVGVRTKNVGNEVKRSLLESFFASESVSNKHGLDETHVGELLKCILVLDFDFDHSSSTRLRDGLRNCQMALASGQLVEAENLWDLLLSIASEYRPLQGSLVPQQLVDKLRGRYRLREFPDFEADWRKLSKFSTDNLASIQDKIGSTIQLPRLKELQEVVESFQTTRTVALLGSSGCGKSVLAKLFAEQQLLTHKVLWWKVGMHEGRDLGVIQSSIGLSHPLTEVVENTNGSKAYLIVDGLDRAFKMETFETLSVVIQKLRLGSPQSPWHLLLTCQGEDWDRVQSALKRSNLPEFVRKEIFLLDPSIDELGSIWESFPPLSSLIRHSHLWPLLFKPKVLDLLATKLSQGQSIDASRWVGESDLIEWFWSTEIVKPPDGIERARFIRSFGELQASELASEIPIDKIGDTGGLQSLVDDRILRFENDRISLTHEIYGDWARLRAILTNENDLRNFLSSRMDSPIWHRALRLYGLHLLEQHQGIDRWKSVFDSMEDDHAAQDLLLDATIFAAQPNIVLERLWSELLGNNGKLLLRLLNRFLHVATIPNPLIMKVAEQFSPDYSTHAATVQRVPNFLLWGPILRFLFQHKDEIVDHQFNRVSSIAYTWLRFSDNSWPMRSEIGEIAVGIAEKVLALRLSRAMFVDKGDAFSADVFKAALTASFEHRDRVVSLALAAAGRSEPEGKILEEKERLNKEQEDLRKKSESTRKRVAPIPFPSISSYHGENRPPWPLGPKRRVDSAFQQVCFQSDALHPLMKSDPNIVREILLSLLINEPSPKDNYRGMSISGALELDDDPLWWPPFYSKGPFLVFLKQNTDEGLKLILQLVNFMSERWSEEIAEAGRPTPGVSIELPDRTMNWVGNSYLYFAYRGVGHAPNCVVSALMALEKWFYDCLDQGDSSSVQRGIDMILSDSQSVSFAGLLSAIARKDLKLLMGSLKMLMATPEFHFWEFASSHQLQFSMMGWEPQSPGVFRVAEEWHSLAHRKTGLDQWAQSFLLNRKDMREFFESVRTNWLSRSSVLEVGSGHRSELEELAFKFDPNNWRLRQDKSGSSFWELVLTKEKEEKNQQAINENNDRILLLSFPIKARRLLDGNLVLPVESLEEFWLQLQRVAGMESSSITNAVTPDDSISGGIAVLFKFYRDWLRGSPDREKWCKDQLLRIVTDHPEDNESHRSFDNTTWVSDYFCAEVGPILWAEDIQSPRYRRMMVTLSLRSRDTVTQAVFQACGDSREILGKHFNQLQNLFVAWEILHFQKKRLERQSKHKIPLRMEAETIRKSVITSLLARLFKTFLKSDRMVNGLQRRITGIEKKLRKLECDFINGNMQKHPHYSKIPLVVAPEQKPYGMELWEGELFVENIGLNRMQAAFAWLPSLNHARNPLERREWFQFWENVLDATIKLIESDRDENSRIKGTPTAWDRWVLKSVARNIQSMGSEEESAKFWKTILDLGPEAHYWTDDFFTEWFVVGLTTPTDTFMNEWRSMVEYAFTNENWESKSDWISFDLEDLWCQLFGLESSLIPILWVKSSEPTVIRVKDLFDRWARKFLGRPRMALRFMYFLEQPACHSLQLTALPMVEEFASRGDDAYWKEHFFQDRMMSYLDLCWRRDKELRALSTEFSSFKKLLRLLSARQNPVALQLLDQVAQTH